MLSVRLSAGTSLATGLPCLVITTVSFFDCTSSMTACKTIGHAIALAASNDSLQVAAATYKENLTITLSLTIAGSGASKTIIDGGAANTVITISNANADVTISKVTIQDGLSDLNSSGGIYNNGTLTISSSTISGNLATASGDGGGIFNAGRLTINNSTVSGNQMQGHGGGIENVGTATINNSTITGNIAGYIGFGGGISNLRGTVTINNSTLSGNSATFKGGGIENDGNLKI